MQEIPFVQQFLNLDRERCAQQQCKTFLTYIKCADPATHDLFYKTLIPSSLEWIDTMKEDFSQLAIRCTAQALYSAGTHSLNKCVTDGQQQLKQLLSEYSPKYGAFIFKKTLDSLNFSQYFQDKDGWKNMISTISSPTYIVGELVSALSSSQESVRLLLGAIDSYSPEDGEKVRKAWKEPKELAGYTEVLTTPPDWFFDYTKDITTFVRNFTSEVTEACNHVTKSESFQKEEDVVMGDTGICTYLLVTYRRDYHGEDVQQWCASDNGPKKYKLDREDSIDLTTVTKISSERKTSSSGCVAVNTHILMADGTKKKIQDLEEGELVMSKEGEQSLFSGERVHTPGIKAFYSINGSDAVFSLDHAVMTEDGWKSMAPEISNRITPYYHVTRLQEGDMVLRARENSDSGRIEYYKEPVRKLHIEICPDGVDGYDLHFQEGYHSYYAEGFLCLLNYPHITLHNLQKTMEKEFSKEDYLEFYRCITENDRVFKKVLGKDTFQHLSTFIHTILFDEKGDTKCKI